MSAHRRIEVAQRKLRALARSKSTKLSHRDLFLEVIDHLDVLWLLKSEVSDLRRQLEFVDNAHDSDRDEFPPGLNDLIKSLDAIARVEFFLNIRAPSKVLSRLRVALGSIAVGATTPRMFRPLPRKGRRPDAPIVQQVKGVLAGLMHRKQKEGFKRSDAAAWIARHISKDLARHLSDVALTSRVVEEWLDRYGGRTPPNDPGGESFKIWSRSDERPLTVKLFKEITSRIAPLLPT